MRKRSVGLRSVANGRISFPALALASLASVAASQVMAAPPLATILTSRPLSSPAAAWTYFGTSATRTTGPVAPPAAPPELVSVAMGLGSGRSDISDSQYARNVFDYVRNNIANELRFGLGKGGRGALIDQSGTPFDQAELMVKLLKQRVGLAPTYNVGVIRLTAAEFGRWTGFVKGLNVSAQTFTVDGRSACQLLADGGIPAIISTTSVSNVSNCASISGDLTSVDVGHIWVALSGNLYDPSFKRNFLFAPPDLASLAGCGNNAAATCGTGATAALMVGAVSSTIGSGSAQASVVRSLNTAGLATQLNSFASTIETSIRSQAPSKSFNEFAGMPQIDFGFSPTVSTSLAYGISTQYTWAGDIPDQFRSKVRVRYPQADMTLFVDELAGRRLYSLNGYGSLYLDGTAIASGSATVSSVEYTLDAILPYVSNNLETHSFFAEYTPGAKSVSIVTNWGRATSSSSAFFGDLAMVKPLYWGSIYYPTIVNDGFPLASTLLSQQDNGLKALSSLYQVALTPQYSLGLIGKSGSTRVSMARAVSANSATNNAALRTSVFQSLAGLDALMESEFSNSYPEAGASGFFNFYNAQGLSFVNVTAANISNVLPSLTNYSVDSKTRLSSATTAGYSVITPLNGKAACVTLPYWPPGLTAATAQACPYDGSEPGINYKADAIGYLIGQKWKGNAVSAPSVFVTSERKEYSFKQSKYATIDPARGAVVLKPAPDLVTGWGDYPYSLSFERTFDTSATSGIRVTNDPGTVNTLPINISTVVRPSKGWTFLPGKFVGSNIPTYYTYLGSADNGSMTHNLEFEARIAANVPVMTGQRSALDTPHFLAGIVTLQNLNAGGSFNNRLATGFTQDWLTTMLRESVVSVSRGTGTTTFVKLPSGVFHSPTAPDSKLTMTGTRSGPYYLEGANAKIFAYPNLQFQLADGAGSILAFDGTFTPTTPIFTKFDFGKDGTAAVATSETVPFGIKVSFEHFRTQLKSIKNSIGRSIYVTSTSTRGVVAGTVTYELEPYVISSISDDTGRVASFAMNQTQFTATRPGSAPEIYDFEVGAFSPDPTDPGRLRGRLRRWFTPLDSVQPFQTFIYDPMYRVVAKTDARGNSMSIYGGVSANEGTKVVSQKDALGNVSVATFDASNKPVSSIDPLGRKMSNTHDDAGRLLRTIYHEGNAVEYQYDLRGNKTRECAIPKGAVTWASLTALIEKAPQCNIARTPVADLATTTTYVEAANLWAYQCVNMKTCNKPSYVIDAKGNRTNYTWSATHGQLLTETGGFNAAGSCALAGGVCPVTTYTYTAFTGVDGATFYLLASKQETISSGVTTTTTYEYDTANKFVLKSQVVDTGGLALRTCFTFDATGNLISKTEPKAGLASCP
jgi:YD repeat-containing protein